MNFVFDPNLTANTYNSPNTALSGNAWATFLLGAIDNKSTDSSIPIQKPRVNYVGIFVQDAGVVHHFAEIAKAVSLE